MSGTVFPENAPDYDPNPEGEDVTPDAGTAGDQGEQSVPEPEDPDEADFDGSEFL